MEGRQGGSISCGFGGRQRSKPGNDRISGWDRCADNADIGSCRPARTGRRDGADRDGGERGRL